MSVLPPCLCLLKTTRANMWSLGSACGIRQALLPGLTSSFHFPGVLPAFECAQQRCLLGQGCSAALPSRFQQPGQAVPWRSGFSCCLFWTVPLVLLSSRLPGRWGALVLPALFLLQLPCLPEPRSAGCRGGVERVPPGSVPWGCCPRPGRAAGVH